MLRQVRELQATAYSTAGQSNFPDEIVEEFLNQLDLKDATRGITRLGSIHGAAEQQAFREAFGVLEPVLEQIVAEAAPRILQQFKDFVRKRQG
jgi:hypothetical protein